MDCTLFAFFHLRLKGNFITLLQYRFSSLTFSLSFSCSEPNYTYFFLWILPTSLINLLFCSYPCSHTFSLCSFFPCYIKSKRDKGDDKEDSIRRIVWSQHKFFVYPKSTAVALGNQHPCLLTQCAVIWLPWQRASCHANFPMPLCCLRISSMHSSPAVLCSVSLAFSPSPLILPLIFLNASYELYIIWLL